MVPGSDNDTVELWVNPEVGQPEPPADAISSVDPGNDVDPGAGIRGFRTRDRGVQEVDELRIGTTWDDVIGSLGGPQGASLPSPGDIEDDVPRDVVLSWAPGDVSVPPTGYTLFLSENFNDVNDGISGIALDSNEYIPEMLLDYGVTYYWRVDESSDTGAIVGKIWSFEIEPFARPVPGDVITVTADSNAVGQGPENTINGSGLTGDLHTTDMATMWLSSPSEPNQVWIQYDLGKPYKLHQMQVWNFNGEAANILFGFKEVRVEYSEDAEIWMSLDNVSEFHQAPGADDYAPNTVIDLNGLLTQHIRITAISNWGGGGAFFNQYGLSEVRFLHIPVFARHPEPLPGATVSLDVILGWRAGREAALHNLYVGTDPNALQFVDAVSESSFNTLPLDLQLDQTYHWRIDEVNDAESPSLWEGDVWNFTIPENELVGWYGELYRQ